MNPDALDELLSMQYDAFQSIHEAWGEGETYFNWGYAKSLWERYVATQEELVRQVLDAAALRPEHRIADVGFGSGAQDFFAAAH